MTALTVFRVENPVQHGPYRILAEHTRPQQDAARDMAERHSEWLRWYDSDYTVETHPHLHPGPFEDPGMAGRWNFSDWSARRAVRHYRFGFLTEQRLREWFFGERETLDLLNMHVAAYAVPHQAVMRGHWQVAFRAPSSTLLFTRSLKEVGVE